MTFPRRRFLAIAALTGAFPKFALAQDDDSFSRIRASKSLRLGVTSAEPWFFRDSASGQWTGIGIAIGQLLAAELGVTLALVETTWANAVAALQARQIDLMLVLDPTVERRKAIDFPSSPLFYYAVGALVASDSTVMSFADLDSGGMRVGLTLGTSVDTRMTGQLKSAQIYRFSNNDEAISAFAARRVDAVLQFHPALVVQYARLKLGKVILPRPVEAVAASAGLRLESSPAFRDWLSARFEDLYDRGVPDRLFQDYLKARNIDPAGIPGLVKEAWR